jgi:hypothetical protein
MLVCHFPNLNDQPLTVSSRMVQGVILLLRLIHVFIFPP